MALCSSPRVDLLTGCFTNQPGALVELFKGRAPDFWTLGLAELVEGHCSGDFLLQGQPGHGVVSSLSLPSKRDQRWCSLNSAQGKNQNGKHCNGREFHQVELNIPIKGTRDIIKGHPNIMTYTSSSSLDKSTQHFLHIMKGRALIFSS